MGHVSIDAQRAQWPAGSPRERSFDQAQTSRAWSVLRWLTLVLVGLSVIAGPLVGERQTSYAELQSGLHSGAVTDVRVETHHLDPDGTLREIEQGIATYRLVWRDGLLRHSTTVRQEVGAVGGDTSSEPLITGPIDEELRQAGPDVRLTYAQPRTAWITIGPYEAPPLLGLLPLAAAVLWLAVLTQGPEPRLATRWAWFWLAFSPAVLVVAPTYLILGAQGTTPGAQRLTGGRAFLTSILFLGGIGFAAS